MGSSPIPWAAILILQRWRVGGRTRLPSSRKSCRDQEGFGGPKTQGGVQVYPGFLYDTGIAAPAPIRGILSPGPGIFGPAPTAMEVDVAAEALADVQPLVDSISSNLTTFSGMEAS